VGFLASFGVALPFFALFGDRMGSRNLGDVTTISLAEIDGSGSRLYKFALFPRPDWTEL
jgi:hypothetical protein